MNGLAAGSFHGPATVRPSALTRYRLPCASGNQAAPPSTSPSFGWAPTRGHLARQPNPADGRSRLISLTARGQQATEGCFPSFGAAIEAFRRHLDVPEPPLLAHLEAAARALQAAAAGIAADGPTAVA